MDRCLVYLFFFKSIALIGQVVIEPEIDATAPIIQTWDYTSRHILVGDPFDDHGVTAWDETDGDIEVVLSGNLDTSTVGVYTQTYTATDSSGNIASESQTIFVVGSREELLVFIDNDDGQTTVLFTADPSIRGDLEVPATWQGKSVVEVNSLAWCDKLTSVTLPDSVTHLRYGAFQSCTSLKSIHIGAGLSTFGEWVFNADCDSLTTITVSASNQNYTSVDGALYSKDMKTLYSVPEGTTGEFVVSEEVNRLEDTAFAGCKKLSSILFKGSTAPSLGTDVFEGLQMSYGDWFGYAKKYEGATGYETGDYALIDFTTVSLEPEDTEAPILGLNGQAEVVLEYPAGYVEEGAQAQDAVDGQVAVTISGEVNPQQLGEYKLTYTAVDNAGNTASTTRTVTVVDTTSPVITLMGGTTIEMEAGSNYLEPGLSINDNYDGVIVDYQINGSVDTNQPGEYVLTYAAKDSSGNTAELNRKVKVIETEDTVAPIIMIIGNSSLTIEFGDKYVEQGATAQDNKDGELNVQIIGAVDNQKLGKYEITYEAIDNSKNLAQKKRTIEIVDNISPIITLNGELKTEISLGVNWQDPGVTAVDNYDGEIEEVSSLGTVNVSVPGTYVVSYFVSDSSGNSSSIDRTIMVIAPKDITPPEITVKGSEGSDNNNYIAYRTDGKWMANGKVLSGQEWADPGVKIIDDTDGEISSYSVKSVYEKNEKIVTGVVEQTQVNNLRIKMLGDDFVVSKTGIVNLIYEVTDSAGNTSTAKRSIYLLPAFPNNLPVINEFIFANFSKFRDFESYLSAYISDLNQPFSLNLEAQYTKNPKGLESGFTFRDLINPGRHLRNYIGYLPHNLTSNPAPWAWSLLSEDVNRFIPLVDLEINSSGIVLGRIRRDTYLVGPPMLGMSATVGMGGPFDGAGELGRFAMTLGPNSYAKGDISSENWDFKLDFNREEIRFKLAPAGLEPLLFIPELNVAPTVKDLDTEIIVTTMERYPGKLPVNYDSDNKPDGKILAPGKPAGKGWQTAWSLLFGALKAGGLNTIPLKAKPGKETFAIQELSFIDDPVNNVGGVKGMFSFGGRLLKKKRSTPKDKDVDALAIGGELSFVSDPFQLNSIALQAKNMRILVPYTGSGQAAMYWQDAGGGFYDLAFSPWRFSGNTLFSYGPDKYEFKKVIEEYLFSVKGNVEFWSSGYFDLRMSGDFLGYPITTARVLSDPGQSKIKASVKDMPFVPPYFWLDGGIGVTKANFDAYGKCRIGIPRTVPVIGGATVAGVEWGLKETKPKWDLYAQFGYQITPDIPKICSPVQIKFNTKKKRVWWDKCCTRAPWWLGGGCIGCPKFDFKNLVSFKWKTVCSKPIPGVKGKFRVGVLFNPNGSFYGRPAGTYVSDGDFFETMYLADYPDWEIPFYYHQNVSERHTMYFNYNWDRLYKHYSVTDNTADRFNNFKPLVKPNPTQGIEADLGFDIPENLEVAIFRLNYSGRLNESADFYLELPDGTLYQGVDDNRPNGYPSSQPLVSSTHIRENREIFFTVVEPLPGKYNVVLAKSENIGEYTIEVLKQNAEPVIEYLELISSEAKIQEPDQLHLQIQALINDTDTLPDNINVRVYLDKTKGGFDGVLVSSTNLSTIGEEGIIDILFADHTLNSGQYYAYLEVDDNRNAPVQRYATGKVRIITPYAVDPVTNLKTKALNGGIAVKFDKSSMDTGFFDYDVIIRDEFFPDNTGLTHTITDNSSEAYIYGLENGKPYLVSVAPVDPETLETGAVIQEHRVVPGLSGQRPLLVYSNPPATATHGYPYQYQIKAFDGDSIENGQMNAELNQELSYKIVNAPEGVEIDSGGFLSWNPDGVQPGEYQFSINISKIFYDESDQAITVKDSKQDCLHEFRVLVNPAYNLSGVSESNLIVFSQPSRKVGFSEIYNYRLDVSGNLDTMNITVTEGPEGMVYDPATNAVVWVADREYSDFVEITIYDASFTKELARQRWFLDVVSEDTILNTELQITGYEQALTDDGSIQTLIYWDAPQGAYEVQATTDLNGAWQSINGEVYEGGLGQVYGLDIQLDQGPAQLFIRVVPVDLQ